MSSSRPSPGGGLSLSNPWAEVGARRAGPALRAVTEDRTPPPSPAADRTQVGPRRGGPSAEPLGLLLVNAPDPAAIGTFVPLGAEALVVGRSGEASVRVEDPGISRLHVRVTRREDGCHLAEDLDSTNGTFLNGSAIRTATLVDGDRLQIGTGTELLFGARRADMEEMIRLRQALGAAGAGAWEWTPASDRLVLSGGLARALRPDAEVTEPREDDWTRILREDRDRVRSRLRDALESGALELECRLLRRDGSVAWVTMKGEAFRDHAGRPVRVAGTAVDVTERKRAEIETRRQALLFDSLSDGLVVVGRDGAIVDWNVGAERLFGWTKGEAVGRRPGALLHPERLDALTERLVRARQEAWPEPEEQVLRHKGGGEAIVELTAVPLRSEDDAAVATVAVFRDRGERRRLEARLQLAERLASLGTLAAGVAHEINNPLCFVTANLQFAVEHSARARAGAAPFPTSEVDAALADAVAGASRIRTIVQDLRQYTDVRAAREGPVDLGEALEFSLRIADIKIRDRARVRKDIATGIPPVRGEPSQVGQVLLNLLVNAADAIPPGRSAENEIAVAARHDAAASRVIVEITDTGAGISPQDAPHVFDPFYTTKPIGVGTGLGLFVAHGLVTALGGEIAFEPGPGGRGTTFRIALVPAEAEPEPPRARLLVVDDEPLFGQALARYFGGSHEVVVSTDPRAALDRIRAGERFTLLLLDLAMPDMGGQDFLGALRECAPDQAERTVIVTAGAPDGSLRELLASARLRHLLKPFDLSRLGEIIAETLAQEEASRRNRAVRIVHRGG